MLTDVEVDQTLRALGMEFKAGNRVRLRKRLSHLYGGRWAEAPKKGQLGTVVGKERDIVDNRYPPGIAVKFDDVPGFTWYTPITDLELVTK